MRHFRLIWILLAGSLAFVLPSHGEVVFSAKARTFNGVHSVEFNGQGWQNLRWITLVTTVGGAKLPVTSYVVCGTGKFLIPTLYAAPKPHEIYPDKDESDAVVSLGGLREISAKEFVFDLEPSDEKRLNVAIDGVCAMELQTSDEYPDLYVAKSGGWFFDLLPETFSRSGDVISVSSRRQKYREESGKAGPFDRDFRIIERRAGSLVSELKIDCEKLAFATPSRSRADHIGSGQLDSQVAASLEKPVAGTIGEETVRLACLIR